MVFEIRKPCDNKVEKHCELVTLAYNLRTTKSVEKALSCSPSATKKTKRLWVDICLIARLRVAFKKFKQIAINLPSFSKVTIILLPHHSAPTNLPGDPLKLKQTMSILELELDSPKLKGMISPNWTVVKADQEFNERQREGLNIHAEVQILVFLSSSEQSLQGILPCFGCSKLNCFMCYHLLRSHGKLLREAAMGRSSTPGPYLKQQYPNQIK